jgi:hypothetical protein
VRGYLFYDRTSSKVRENLISRSVSDSRKSQRAKGFRDESTFWDEKERVKSSRDKLRIRGWRIYGFYC